VGRGVTGLEAGCTPDPERGHYCRQKFCSGWGEREKCLGINLVRRARGAFARKKYDTSSGGEMSKRTKIEGQKKTEDHRKRAAQSHTKKKRTVLLKRKKKTKKKIKRKE